MINFQIDPVASTLRQALVNEDLGTEKMGVFYIHPSLAESYLKSALAATDAALRTALGLNKPAPDPKSTK